MRGRESVLAEKMIHKPVIDRRVHVSHDPGQMKLTAHHSHKTRMPATVWIVAVIVVLVLMIVALAPFFLVKEDAVAEKDSSIQYTPHDRIYIDGNDDFTSENGVTSGSGTESDPYIIAGWNIIGWDPTGSTLRGIEIQNTDAHFIVRDCFINYDEFQMSEGITLINCKNGTLSRNICSVIDWQLMVIGSSNIIVSNNSCSPAYDGILISSSSNIIVSNNDCSLNQRSGIVLFSSSNNTLSDNNCSNNLYGICLSSSSGNSVSQNHIRDNQDAGVSISAASYNTIWSNTFVGNNGATSVYSTEHIQVDDSGSNNAWNTASVGNYWSDYNGIDANGDGIGDTPYVIDSDSQDRYPLMEPYTHINTPPVALFSVSPSVGTLDTTFTFDATESYDDWDPTASLEVRWNFENDTYSSGWDTVWSTSKTVSHKFGFYGIYPVHLQVRDSGGLIDDEIVYVTVKDEVESPSSYSMTSWVFQRDAYTVPNTYPVYSTIGSCFGWSSTAVLYYRHYVFGDLTCPYLPMQYPIPTETSDLMYVPAYGGSALNNVSLAIMMHQNFDNKNGFQPGLDLGTEFEKLQDFIISGIPVVMEVGPIHPHAVVAFGLEYLPSGVVYIRVSDPNCPSYISYAVYNPSSESFFYDGEGDTAVWTEFNIENVEPLRWSMLSDLKLAWLSLVSPYSFIISTKPVLVKNLDNLDECDYFLGAYLRGVQEFRMGIAGSAGVKEGNLEVYAIPDGVRFSLFDPTSGESGVAVAWTDNGTGVEVGHSVTVGIDGGDDSYNYSLTPFDSGFEFDGVGADLDVNITLTSIWDDGYCMLNVTSIPVPEAASIGVEVSDWSELNSTSDSSVTLSICIDGFEEPVQTYDLVNGQEGLPDAPPVAVAHVAPLAGDVTTTFIANASLSVDVLDSSPVLEVRWDFDGDGIWDTDWSTEKVAYHQYDSPGEYTVLLEVRDTSGLTNTTSIEVVVIEAIPEFSTVVVPVLSLLFLMVLVARGRLRRDKPKKPG